MSTPDDMLERLGELVERMTGLMLSDVQRRRLAEHAAQRVERLRLPSADAYLELLARETTQSGEGRGEIDLLIEEVTVRETSFYRDPLQCEAIRATLAAIGPRRRPMVWSAGCASGEEAYTLAMLAAECGADVEILGTDINVRALEIARAGVYDAWAVRRLAEPLRARYLEPVDGERFRVRDALRAKVRFRVHNLLSPPPRPFADDGTWDVILCRNLFIYLARDTVTGIARRLLGVLGAEGRLFTGAAETLAVECGAEIHLLAGTFAYGPVEAPSALPPSPPDPPPSIAPPPRGDDLVRRARAALEEGRADDALGLLQEAEQQDSLRGDVHYWQALAHRRHGQSEAARNGLRGGSRSSPHTDRRTGGKP